MRFMETVNLKQLADNLSIILLYFTAFFYVVWGATISKEDFETGKIKNILIIHAIKFAGAIIFIQIILTIMGEYGYVKNYLKPEFYIYFIYHIMQSAIFSYILWYGEVWPAGDSKFFTANMILIPLLNPSASGFPGYLWLISLINIFIIASLFSIYRYIKDNTIMLKKGDNDAFREIKNYYQNEFKKFLKLKPENIFLIFSLFSMFAYKQMLNILLQNYIFNIFHRTDIFFFLFYFLWPKISTMLKSKAWKYIMFLFYLLMFLFISSSLDPVSLLKNIFIISVKNTFKFGMIFAIGKIVFEKIIETHNTFYASKDEIKPGMILSSYELEVIKKNEVFSGLFDDLFRDGLNQQQVDALKRWMENHPDKNVKLRFIKAKPFAFAIFSGCILQIIINKNILRFIL